MRRVGDAGAGAGWVLGGACAWVFFPGGRSFRGWNAPGFRPRGSWGSSWVIGAALLLVAVAVTIATRLHTLREPISGRGWVMTFGGYVVWSLAQQFLLQSYFLYRFRQLMFSERFAAFATTGIFAAAPPPH